MSELDALDHQLLNLLQTQIPLVDRPFADMARQLKVDEAEVLRRLGVMKTAPAPKRPLIRQISAIFDSKALGYQSTLVAARIEESHLDQAAEVINRHPGVSHNYRRNHAFNLWYTLAVPPDSKLGLEKTLDILHQKSGSLSTRMLPTLRLFKIGVKFDLSEDADLDARTQPAATAAARPEAAASPLTECDKQIIRVLQQDLPICSEPFHVWARELHIPVSQLLDRACDMLERKLMRRFAAVLRHREAGISANAMGVWAVPPEQQESFGQAAAGFKAVSHCYLRRSYPDWPYTLFTMVHAPTQEQCESVLATISKETGISQYGALYSSKEYKKTRVQYFTPAVHEWEEANGA